MKSSVVAVVLSGGILGLVALGVSVSMGVIMCVVPKASKPGTGLTGGTVLTYEIEAQGLSDKEKKGLSQRMIIALRRRADPSGELPLVWRPLGDTRLEVAMPPVRPETRQKRRAFDTAMTELLTKNPQSGNARSQPDQFKLTLTGRQVEAILEMPSTAPDRATRLAQLKSDFPEQAQLIDKVVAAYDEYRPLRGRLDDPNDLQRVLQNPGVLEFRMLPTRDLPRADTSQVEQYLARLQEKGPQSTPGDKYVWCEIENPQERRIPNTITSIFAGRLYVLAGNDPNESLLQRPGRDRWELKSARSTTDAVGHQAIDFTLDQRGGELFYQLTAKNIGRPLAILLDDRVISAPNIHSAIRDRGIIVGSFTPTQISDMVRFLNAGSLPARLIQPPLSIKAIGRGDSFENSLGEETVPARGPNETK